MSRTLKLIRGKYKKVKYYVVVWVICDKNVKKSETISLNRD